MVEEKSSCRLISSSLITPLTRHDQRHRSIITHKSHKYNLIINWLLLKGANLWGSSVALLLIGTFTYQVWSAKPCPRQFFVEFFSEFQKRSFFLLECNLSEQLHRVAPRNRPLRSPSGCNLCGFNSKRGEANTKGQIKERPSKQRHVHN